MNQVFQPDESDRLREVHRSITPEEKAQEEDHSTRAARREERRAFQLKHRHDKFKLVRK